MAKDKTKDELKAETVDKEISDTTIEEVKHTDPKAKEQIEKEEKSIAKSGKRSAKALKEQEEKEAKEAKKQAGEEEKQKKKAPQKPARSKLARKSKRFRESAKLIDKSKEYALKEALELTCKTGKVKFDASVEVHVRLNVDPKQADQNIRDSVVLPEGSGKSVKVAVLADDNEAKKAKSAGASIVGTEEIFEKLDKQQVEFDVLIATPELMQKLSKYARLLGPKGLMPNPKSGTVAKNVEKAVKDTLAGKLEYRVDGSGIVHTSIGKLSFGSQRLGKNAQAIIESIKQKKPASVKGAYIKSFYVTSTMGPSIQVNTSEIL